jgi:hypothetical protein
MKSQYLAAADEWQTKDNGNNGQNAEVPGIVGLM